MKFIITNAFSINMFTDHIERIPRFIPITVDVARRLARHAESAVGHEGTAALFTDIVGIEIPYVRSNVKLDNETILVVGQYTGPRLQEGTTVLPDGAEVRWWIVAEYSRLSWTDKLLLLAAQCNPKDHETEYTSASTILQKY